MSSNPAVAFMIELPEGGLQPGKLQPEGEDFADDTSNESDTGSLSSEGSSYGSEEDSDSDEDDSSYYSDSSSEGSLEDLIETFGGAAFAKPPTQTRPNLGQRHSMPNLSMQLEIEPDLGAMDAEHRRSLTSFMTRMNSCANTSYFQASSAQPPLKTRARSTGAIDEIHKDTNTADKQSPANFFKDMLRGIIPQNAFIPESFWESYFLPISEERVERYTSEAVRAIRSMDFDALRKMVHEQGDTTAMDACSKQGESLLHVACRRGNKKLIQFMVQESHATIKVRDDWHKTALDELCWNSKVVGNGSSHFESVKMLLQHAPELLFCKDKRGFTALQYVPKESWVGAIS